MSKVSNVILRNVQIGFPNLFVPKTHKANPGGEPRYSVMLVIPEKGAAFKSASEAINQILTKDFAEAKGSVTNPLRLAWDHPTGAYEGHEVYKGKYLLNASNRARPAVVDRKLNSLSAATGEQFIYPGCVCNVWITVSGYDKGSKGVAAYLEAVQWVSDGERLDHRPAANQVFEVLDDEPNEDEAVPSFLGIS